MYQEIHKDGGTKTRYYFLKKNDILICENSYQIYTLKKLFGRVYIFWNYIFWYWKSNWCYIIS